MATYIEACGNMGPETATVRLENDGSVTVLIGSQSTGQGHATAYAQLVAEHLGLAPDRVRMVQGDTDLVATGGGTGGSSSIPCGGASLDGASKKLATEIKRLAADALEASPGDLEITDGRVRVVGTDRAISFAEVAARAGKDRDKLRAANISPRASRPIRTAPTSPKSRSIPAPARSRSSITSSSTISAPRSIR